MMETPARHTLQKGRQARFLHKSFFLLPLHLLLKSPCPRILLPQKGMSLRRLFEGRLQSCLRRGCIYIPCLLHHHNEAHQRGMQRCSICIQCIFARQDILCRHHVLSKRLAQDIQIHRTHPCSACTQRRGTSISPRPSQPSP